MQAGDVFDAEVNRLCYVFAPEPPGHKSDLDYLMNIAPSKEERAWSEALKRGPN